MEYRGPWSDPWPQQAFIWYIEINVVANTVVTPKFSWMNTHYTADVFVYFEKNISFVLYILLYVKLRAVQKEMEVLIWVCTSKNNERHLHIMSCSTNVWPVYLHFKMESFAYMFLNCPLSQSYIFYWIRPALYLNIPIYLPLLS